MTPLDKFRAELVDDIVWCLRNNVTVEFHEDKTVTIHVSGVRSHRCNTFHDAVKAASSVHWRDCAANHGGTCDMGPDCGSDEEVQS